MAPGIVHAGDRLQGGRAMRPIAAYPPREIPGLALWSGCLRNTAVVPLAFGATLATLAVGAAMLLDPAARRDLPIALPCVLAVAAFVGWMFAVRAMRRARALLEGGMPVAAKLVRVRVNSWVRSNGRVRTTLEYDWLFAGQSRRTKTSVYLGRGERTLATGQEIALVCDPTSGDHLVPRFYGFALQGFTAA